ncbi:MAG: hypothetical protein AAF203_02240 [Pseudomonadota bacterium]
MIKQLLVMSILAVSSAAFGMPTETMTFLRSEHFKGQNTFRIKANVQRQLNQQGKDISDYKLEGITLYAKSRRGNGTATLVVGPDQRVRNVPQFGGAGAFQIDAPWAFHELEWDLANPGTSDERWQIRFQGNIKVKKMEVHLSRKERRIRIPMGDIELRGSNTIRIKRELRDLGYRPNRLNLRRVILVAKTRRGRGTAELFLGNDSFGTRVVDQAQNGYGFQSTNPQSYDRVRWNARGHRQGPWQLDLDGRFKVKALVVVVD